jgi:hypothetical protein
MSQKGDDRLGSLLHSENARVEAEVLRRSDAKRLRHLLVVTCEEPSVA